MSGHHNSRRRANYRPEPAPVQVSDPPRQRISGDLCVGAHKPVAKSAISVNERGFPEATCPECERTMIVDVRGEDRYRFYDHGRPIEETQEQPA